MTDPFPSEHRKPEQPKQPAPSPRPRRTPRTPEGTLGIALLAYAAVNGIAGVLIALAPQVFWETIGSADSDFGRAFDSTRFAGGALLALAIGALAVLRRPAGQYTLVTVFALEATFVAAAAAGNVAVNDTATGWIFDWVVLLGGAAVAGYMWWARVKARRILKPRSPDVRPKRR